LTLKGGYHLTLLAKDNTGYSNLCRLITVAHHSGERNEPELAPELLAEHAARFDLPVRLPAKRISAAGCRRTHG